MSDLLEHLPPILMLLSGPTASKSGPARAAGPDFEAAGPDFEVAGPDFKAAGPDFEAGGPNGSVVSGEYYLLLRVQSRNGHMVPFGLILQQNRSHSV